MACPVTFLENQVYARIGYTTFGLNDVPANLVISNLQKKSTIQLTTLDASICLRSVYI